MSNDSVMNFFFGKITPGGVEGTIRQLSRAWYVLAAIQAVLLGFLVFERASPPANLVDPLLCALGGYFLARRKSRAVAVSLFLYALLSSAITLAAGLGMATGGRNVILALATIVIAWRGIHATWVYFSSRKLRTAWGRVAAISAVVLVALVAIFIGVFYWAIRNHHSEDEDTMSLLTMGAVVATLVLVMAPLTWRYPFAISPGGVDVATVFD